MEKLLILKSWLLLNSRAICLVNKKIAGMVLLVVFFYNIANSQNNLVSNGSFEIYSTCPTVIFGEIDKATPWFQPNYPYAGAGGSSDYVHFCNGLTCYDVQQCPRTGNGIAGVFLFWDSASNNIDKWREYIEVELTDSLVFEKKYCIRFYVNRANNSGYPIKQIQAVLTNDSLLYNDPNYSYISSVTPIMEADSIITDTLDWVKIETTYIAQGGERFLTIGNFSPGSTVNYLITWPYSAPNNSLGYYYIDDVSIYEQPVVFAGNDTIIPPGDSIQIGSTGRPDIIYSWSPATGLNNPNLANPVATPSVTTTYVLTVTDTNQLACTNVFTDTIVVVVGYISVEEIPDCNSIGILYPNPAQNSCTYEATLPELQSGFLLLHDLNGKLLRSYNLISGENKVDMDLSIFTNGVYMYRIVINGETIENKKLVISK